MTALLRTRARARRAVLALAVLAGDHWQCSQCGGWFHSGTPSQTCPSCS
ncbi:hypothetical protein OIE91_31560 [Streptomyces albidoflavus]|nr:hypothetical protein [Streptomyces sp. SM17]MBZ2410837.1 hypothetical protein [Streptomyces sp. L06]